MLDSGVLVLRLCHESELTSSFGDAGAESEFDPLVPVPGHVCVQSFDEPLDGDAGEVAPVEELLLETPEEPLRGRVLSGEQPFALIDRVSLCSPQMRIHPGHR